RAPCARRPRRRCARPCRRQPPAARGSGPTSPRPRCSGGGRPDSYASKRSASITLSQPIQTPGLHVLKPSGDPFSVAVQRRERLLLRAFLRVFVFSWLHLSVHDTSTVGPASGVQSRSSLRS